MCGLRAGIRSRFTAVFARKISAATQRGFDFNSSCANATECLSIAFGAKPCGGPREYLAYPNTVDQTTLETLVSEYYEMDHQYNIEIGAISDCMVVNPPNTINCVNGVCTIIN